MEDFGFCCYCEVKLIKSGTKIIVPVKKRAVFDLRTSITTYHPDSKTRDHILPKHLGGNITEKCCYACNTEKGRRTIDEYVEYLERRSNVIINRTKLKNAESIKVKYNRLKNEKESTILQKP